MEASALESQLKGRWSTNRERYSELNSDGNIKFAKADSKFPGQMEYPAIITQIS